jgi:hypothetical protein
MTSLRRVTDVNANNKGMKMYRRNIRGREGGRREKALFLYRHKVRRIEY